ncbi:MAG: hypothetical protein IPL49_05870 [Saprospirales bacterium]|nr:hypothetical protein [Saprospirales bacterium]
MKKYYFFLLFYSLISVAYTQQDVKLPGIVVEQNSQFHTGKVIYLSNVEIKSVGATPQLSNLDGSFTLVFADRPPGNMVKVYAKKSGYDLVNDKEMEKAAVLGRLAPLKLVMCKEGQLYQNQIAYYQIAEDAVKQSYNQRLKLLEQESKEKDLLIANMQVEFNQVISSADQAKDFYRNN